MRLTRCAQQARIQQLVTDLPAIWNDPVTPARERKRITRLLLTDVTATRTSNTITAHIRLASGQDLEWAAEPGQKHKAVPATVSRGLGA
jgi:hypothetical protein